MLIVRFQSETDDRSESSDIPQGYKTIGHTTIHSLWCDWSLHLVYMSYLKVWNFFIKSVMNAWEIQLFLININKMEKLTPKMSFQFSIFFKKQNWKKKTTKITPLLSLPCLPLFLALSSLFLYSPPPPLAWGKYQILGKKFL